MVGVPVGEGVGRRMWGCDIRVGVIGRGGESGKGCREGWELGSA